MNHLTLKTQISPTDQFDTSRQDSVILREVSKIYPHKTAKGNKTDNDYIVANDDISLSIKKGEIFGLLGPNGAGKTTLISQILGLISPTTGQVVVEGIDVAKDPNAIKKITSYLPQKLAAFGAIPVATVLRFAGQLKGLTKEAAKNQAQELIEELDLGEVASQYVRSLSGGMQRAVGVGIALSGYPKLLVLDEPTNELDPARRRKVWESIKKLNRQRGTTCILVTHNVLEAETILDRTAIMGQGRLLAVGTPGELKQQISNQMRVDLALKPNFLKNYPDPAATLNTLLLDTALNQNSQFFPRSDELLQWRATVPVELADRVLALLTSKLPGSPLDYIDDLKLSLTSLEDVYLNLVETGPIETAQNQSDLAPEKED